MVVPIPLGKVGVLLRGKKPCGLLEFAARQDFCRALQADVYHILHHDDGDESRVPQKVAVKRAKVSEHGGVSPCGQPILQRGLELTTEVFAYLFRYVADVVIVRSREELIYKALIYLDLVALCRFLQLGVYLCHLTVYVVKRACRSKPLYHAEGLNEFTACRCEVLELCGDFHCLVDVAALGRGYHQRGAKSHIVGREDLALVDDLVPLRDRARHIILDFGKGLVHGLLVDVGLIRHEAVVNPVHQLVYGFLGHARSLGYRPCELGCSHALFNGYGDVNVPRGYLAFLVVDPRRGSAGAVRPAPLDVPYDRRRRTFGFGFCVALGHGLGAVVGLAAVLVGDMHGKARVGLLILDLEAVLDRTLAALHGIMEGFGVELRDVEVYAEVTLLVADILVLLVEPL